MSDDVEVVGTVEAKQYTDEEIEQMKSQYTFYGSSKWKKMVEEWRKDNPIIKKELTPEEKAKSEAEIERLNLEWRNIQAQKQNERLENTQRIQEQWAEAENNKIEYLEKLKKKSTRHKKLKPVIR